MLEISSIEIMSGPKVQGQTVALGNKTFACENSGQDRLPKDGSVRHNASQSALLVDSI